MASLLNGGRLIAILAAWPFPDTNSSANATYSSWIMAAIDPVSEKMAPSVQAIHRQYTGKTQAIHRHEQMYAIRPVWLLFVRTQVNSPGLINMVRIEIITAASPIFLTGQPSADDDKGRTNKTVNGAGGSQEGPSPPSRGDNTAPSPQQVAFVRSQAAGWFNAGDKNMTSSDLTTYNVNR